jgi:hypothetical protein
MTGGQGQILDAESLDIVVTRTEPLQLPGTSNAMQCNATKDWVAWNTARYQKRFKVNIDFQSRIKKRG